MNNNNDDNIDNNDHNVYPFIKMILNGNSRYLTRGHM